MTQADLPEKIDRYEIVRLLGEGAMGRVYEARDPQIGRRVAVKTVKKDLRLSDAKRREYMARFERESRAAGRLNHPAIVAVYDAGEDDGTPWIAMEYVDGKSMKELRQSGEPTLASNVVWVAEQVGAALDAAHEQGTIHRDVKPANILISEKGLLKVTDFGIARIADSELTREGVMLGSPSYMSPEHVRGKDIGPCSDLFSLGVILYEWMTGSKPFTGNDLASITHKIVYEKPEKPSELKAELGPAVDAFFARALAKKVRERYQTGKAMADALRTAMSDDPLERTLAQAEEAAAPAGESASDSAATMRSQYVKADRSENNAVQQDRVAGVMRDMSRESRRMLDTGLGQETNRLAWVFGLVAIAGIAGLLWWILV